ncbi:MAG: 2-phosphosulfolactate phosphatase [Pseudomonadota bacterium]
MNIEYKTLQECEGINGVVVVIDVLRAFTTTAYAFARGVAEITMVSTVEEAFELKRRDPQLLLMGEVNAYPIEGFDLPNSPSVIDRMNLDGKRLVMRSTAGTQGVVAAADASEIYVASLSVGVSTAAALARDKPEKITFINTGAKAKGGGEEDVACSDYISQLAEHLSPQKSDIEHRVRNSGAAKRFVGGEDSDLPAADLEYASRFDVFTFVMKIVRQEDQLVLKQFPGTS